MSNSRAKRCGVARSKCCGCEATHKREFAYAWSHETDDGKINHVEVLGVLPINSAVSAVRAVVVAKGRRRTMRTGKTE